VRKANIRLATDLPSFIFPGNPHPEMSFACPHCDVVQDECLRLRTDCVPGRLGCALRDNLTFAQTHGTAPAIADPAKKSREDEKIMKRRSAPDAGRARCFTDGRGSQIVAPSRATNSAATQKP